MAPPTVTWESALRNAQLPLDDSNPMGGAAVHGQAEYFSDRAAQNAIYPHLDTVKQVGEARSFQPLITRGPVLGTLALVWADPHPLTEQDRVTIEALASYSAQAVQRAGLLQERLDALVTLQSALLPELPESELPRARGALPPGGLARPGGRRLVRRRRDAVRAPPA